MQAKTHFLDTLGFIRPSKSFFGIIIFHLLAIEARVLAIIIATFPRLAFAIPRLRPKWGIVVTMGDCDIANIVFVFE